MSDAYRSHVPSNIGEIMELLASIMMSAPTMKHPLFPGRNVETEFFALNEGLRCMKGKLGQDRYSKLIELSKRMRAHFEADPENKTDDTIKGRELIHEMEDLLRKPK